jgi:ribonuclease HI
MEESKKNANWKRMRFKRNKVYVAVDGQDRPIIAKSKVLIKYQLDQKHQYWVHSRSVFPLDESTSHSNNGAVPYNNSTPIDPKIPKKTIRIYTDGSCSENPGPAGIGVVMQYQQHEKEISRYIGTATNNIAELEAIRVGLQSVKNRNLPVVVFTDSSYALGVLAKGWKAMKNIELIQKIKDLTVNFRNLRFIKIKGHAGHPENERVDRLAVQAMKKGGNKEKQI